MLSEYEKRQALKQLSWARRQFERAVNKAKKALNSGNLLSTVVWAQIGADFAYHRHPGFYTSTVLEWLLLDVAYQLNRQTRTLPICPIDQLKHENKGKTHVLHVMTKAYKIGGHTRVVEGWIKNTADTAIHSLLTTTQLDPLPERLTSSIVATGGWYLALAELSSNILYRSALLRQISRNWADIVVLHVHPFDALPVVAFGIEGGPPVILFNHADHVFWLGVSIVDVVADYRLLGQRLTLTRRGIRNSRILPIPLLKANSRPSYEAARKQLGIESDTTMLLTIGTDYKYTPFAMYNFVDTVAKILHQNPKATLYAIGPRHLGQWAEASALVDGRIRAVGVQTNLELFYAAADIYLAGFPLAGLTALLDAGARGIPVIGLYIQEAGWGGADDISLDKLDTHTSSLKEYTALVERMISEPALRHEKGAQIKKHIKSTHFPPGWNSFLEKVLKSLPAKHAVRVPSALNTHMDSYDIFLAGFQATLSLRRTAPHSFSKSVRTHARYLPAHKRVKSFGEVLREISDVQAWFSKMPLQEAALFFFDLLPLKMKLAIKSNKYMTHIQAK
jgi:hypothetical protein